MPKGVDNKGKAIQKGRALEEPSASEEETTPPIKPKGHRKVVAKKIQHCPCCPRDDYKYIQKLSPHLTRFHVKERPKPAISTFTLISVYLNEMQSRGMDPTALHDCTLAISWNDDKTLCTVRLKNPVGEWLIHYVLKAEHYKNPYQRKTPKTGPAIKSSNEGIAGTSTDVTSADDTLLFESDNSSEDDGIASDIPPSPRQELNRVALNVNQDLALDARNKASQAAREKPEVPFIVRANMENIEIGAPRDLPTIVEEVEPEELSASGTSQVVPRRRNPPRVPVTAIRIPMPSDTEADVSDGSSQLSKKKIKKDAPKRNSPLGNGGKIISRVP